MGMRIRIRNKLNGNYNGNKIKNGNVRVDYELPRIEEVERLCSSSWISKPHVGSS